MRAVGAQMMCLRNDVPLARQWRTLLFTGGLVHCGGALSVSLCNRARSEQGNIIEFVQLMNENDSRKVVRLFLRQALTKI